MKKSLLILLVTMQMPNMHAMTSGRALMAARTTLARQEALKNSLCLIKNQAIRPSLQQKPLHIEQPNLWSRAFSTNRLERPTSYWERFKSWYSSKPSWAAAMTIGNGYSPRLAQTDAMVMSVPRRYLSSETEEKLLERIRVASNQKDTKTVDQTLNFIKQNAPELEDRARQATKEPITQKQQELHNDNSFTDEFYSNLFASIILNIFKNYSSQFEGHAGFIRNIERGGYNEVKQAIKNGADVNLQDAKGHTPLYTAIWNNELPILELLLQHGADVNAQDKYGNTALDTAIFRLEPKAVALLLQYGADANEKHPDGLHSTPLHRAANNNVMIEIVKLLLQHGADVTIKDARGETPLHNAASKIAKLLLQHGADVNDQDIEGNTALHQAVQRGYTEEAKVLLQHGANTKIQNKAGKTAFDLAQTDRMKSFLRAYPWDSYYDGI